MFASRARRGSVLIANLFAVAHQPRLPASGAITSARQSVVSVAPGFGFGGSHPAAMTGARVKISKAVVLGVQDSVSRAL